MSITAISLESLGLRETQCPAVVPALSLLVVALSVSVVTLAFVLGAMSGWCLARWGQPVSVVSNISVSVRSIAVQSQTTYKRKLNQPRFQPLPEVSQGVFID